MWTQNYDPTGSWPVSTLAAALPVLVLLGLLASGRASAWLSALAGLVTAAAVAVGVFGMPVDLVLASAVVGVVFAVFRIIWLIVAAVFLYDLAVQTGQFDVMKASIARLSGDRRIQAVLVAFSFGAFIEGAAGFGAPVAISAAFLVGLGFRPFQAALLCLIANTAPVAWGAIGTPILTLSSVTGLDVNALSATSGRILPPLSLIIPFWLVCTMAGWRATVAVWPALLAVGGTFAGRPVRLVELRRVRAGRHRLGGRQPGGGGGRARRLEAEGRVAVRPRRRGPRRLRRAPEAGRLRRPADRRPGRPRLDAVRAPDGDGPALGPPRDQDAWGRPRSSPGSTRTPRGSRRCPGSTSGSPRARPSPAARRPTRRRTWRRRQLDIVPVSSTGTAVFVAAVLSGLFLGVGPATMARTFVQTWVRMVPAIAAIVSMLALGFVTKYSGMDAVLGLAFTRTGPMLYPVFGTLLGWLGVALTGSDTSSNVLFGNLQKITARKLGLSEVLMASANTTGGVMGKMIDAQSIVVAAAATGEGGKEGDILRAVLWHSIALALLVGGIVWLYAHVFPWVVAAR